MANTHNLFQQFNSDLQITTSKNERLKISRDNLRTRIRQYFKENHPGYTPKFYMQGSYKMKNIIRTKDDTCDIDDGVYFSSNQDGITGTTLQTWVKNAVDGATDDVSHNAKCITVNYKADYNIDLPVYLFDATKELHPCLAIKNGDWREDDPKEMVEAFRNAKDSNGQLIRIVRYLKAWCDYKRQKMPNGLAMTILAMNHFFSNERDDVALKFFLIEIEKVLNEKFECNVPATPYDNLFEDYDQTRKDNFLNNLSSFISDAKQAIDHEHNYLNASHLWQKHLGPRFPVGKDEEEKRIDLKTIIPIAGSSRPYHG